MFKAKLPKKIKKRKSVIKCYIIFSSEEISRRIGGKYKKFRA